jgi:Cd2+/Zn2+-exporting ATPase
LLSDTVKKDTVHAINRLKSLNIKNIQILSSDKQSIVITLAGKLGIPHAYGDLLPEGKVKTSGRIKAKSSQPNHLCR